MKTENKIRLLNVAIGSLAEVNEFIQKDNRPSPKMLIVATSVVAIKSMVETVMIELRDELKSSQTPPSQ